MIPFSTSAYAFCNPCNDAFEFIVCTHTSQQYSEPKQHYSETNSSQHLDNSNFYGSGSIQPSMQQYTVGSYQIPSDQLGAYQGQFLQNSQPQFDQQTHLNSLSSHSTATGSGSYGNYLIMPSN